MKNSEQTRINPNKQNEQDPEEFDEFSSKLGDFIRENFNDEERLRKPNEQFSLRERKKAKNTPKAKRTTQEADDLYTKQSQTTIGNDASEMYRTPMGLSTQTEQENKLPSETSFSGEKMMQPDKAWENEQCHKRLPLGEIQNVLQAPSSKDTLFHPVETSVCLVRANAKMDSDSVRSVFENYGDILSVNQKDEFGTEWWIIEFRETTSVSRAKGCLSWKAVAHKGCKMVAFTMEGQLENQEIETKLQENHMLDFLDVTKQPLNIPQRSPNKPELEGWERESRNELLSPHSDIWNSNNNQLSLFSPGNLNQNAQLDSEHNLISPDVAMRNSNMSGNSDSVLSSEHTPNVMTSKYQLNGSSEKKMVNSLEEQHKKELQNVSCNRVCDSTDKRTSLMIKNIPNKYTQPMLLDLIDKDFLGCQDFFQLPVDASNGCNMGYAFINMTCPTQLQYYYKKFHQYKWPNFMSIKICEVAYARLQGYETLINNFQNTGRGGVSDARSKPWIFSQRDEQVLYKELPLHHSKKQKQYKKISLDNECLMHMPKCSEDASFAVPPTDMPLLSQNSLESLVTQLNVFCGLKVDVKNINWDQFNTLLHHAQVMTANSQGVPLNGPTTTDSQLKDSTCLGMQVNTGINDATDADSLQVFSPNSTLASSGGSYHFNEEPHKQTNLSNLNNWSQSIVHEQEENIIEVDTQETDLSLSGLNINATPFITPPPGFGL